MRENAYSRGIVFKFTRRFSHVSPRVTRHCHYFFLSLSFLFRPLSRPNLGSRTNTPSPFKYRVIHPISVCPPLIRVNYVLFKIILKGEMRKKTVLAKNKAETAILKQKRGREEGRKREKASFDFTKGISSFILCA